MAAIVQRPTWASTLAVMSIEEHDDHTPDTAATIFEPRLWRDKGWTAKVIKNEDDDGWAVAMTLEGEAEPALVGPWTMGRNKKDPKPLDVNAFNTLVKTASEVIRRHEQQLQAQLHKQITVTCTQGRVTVSLDIEPDEEQPRARLSAHDEGGDLLADCAAPLSFKLDRASATAWAEGGFQRPEVADR